MYCMSFAIKGAPSEIRIRVSPMANDYFRVSNNHVHTPNFSRKIFLPTWSLIETTRSLVFEVWTPVLEIFFWQNEDSTKYVFWDFRHSFPDSLKFNAFHFIKSNYLKYLPTRDPMKIDISCQEYILSKKSISTLIILEEKLCMTAAERLKRVFLSSH